MRFPFSILLYLILFWTAVPAGAETLRSITIENQQTEKQEEIAAVVRMKPGEEFTLSRLENAINDLRKWGIFHKVEALVRHEDDQVDLTFQLEDAYLIKDIEISGNYPILERKIRRAIFFFPGDVFEADRIPEQIDRLITFYENEGYPNTFVLIETEKNEGQRTITLKIRIEKGRGYRIDRIAVKGNTVFKDSRITNKIGRLFDYSPNHLKKDLQDIQKLYFNQGYYHARVRIENLKFDSVKRGVSFTLSIREGKKIEIHFVGNAHQQADHLRKILSLVESGEADEFELENSRNQLIAHYRSLGYEETKVSVEKKPLPAQGSEVTFTIEEGPRRVIRSIDFEGNSALSDRALKKQMLTQEHSLSQKGIFLKEIFTQDLSSIESFYQQHGFLAAKVEDWKRHLNTTLDKYLIEILIHEGDQTLIDNIDFKGLRVFKPSQIERVLKLKSSSAFSSRQLEEDVRALLVFYANHGYPYAEAKTTLEKVGDHLIRIHYEVIEGDRVHVGRILFVGNLKTRPQAILQALRFREGSPFNPEEIIESQTSLRRLGIFDGLSLETLGLQGKEREVHVVVRVEEKKDQIVDFGLSYDTDTNLKLKVNATRLNLLGKAKKFDFRVTAGLQLNRAEFLYSDPRLFGSDWQFLANIFAQLEQRPYFHDGQAGGSIVLLRDLTPRLSMLMRYEIVNTNFQESHTRFDLLKPGSGDNTTGKLQYSATYDRRDNYGDPRSGIYTLGKVDFGTQFQGRTSNFLKVGERFGHWWSPFRFLTLANTLRTDWIFQVTGPAIPTQELVFSGGDDSVRGFEQDAINPSGGKFGLIHNLELQVRLLGGLQVAGFLDTGTVTQSLWEVNATTLRHSAGVSVRYVTPVGPIRLDYGWILDRKTGENSGRLHFTFGYFF